MRSCSWHAYLQHGIWQQLLRLACSLSMAHACAICTGARAQAYDTILLKQSNSMHARRGNGLLIQEDEARYYFKQLVYAVDYCHRRKDIVHRQEES